MTPLTIVACVYAYPALVVMVMGGLAYFTPVDKNEKRNGARLFLTAPVWPVALVVVIARGLYQMWQTAFTKEN